MWLTLNEVITGTFKSTAEDNSGCPHEIVIPNGLNGHGLRSCLFSPQHLALPCSMWCATYNGCIQPLWEDQQYTMMIRLDTGSGIEASMYTVLCHLAYKSFCIAYGALDDGNLIVDYKSTNFRWWQLVDWQEFWHFHVLKQAGSSLKSRHELGLS